MRKKRESESLKREKCERERERGGYLHNSMEARVSWILDNMNNSAQLVVDDGLAPLHIIDNVSPIESTRVEPFRGVGVHRGQDRVCMKVVHIGHPSAHKVTAVQFRELPMYLPNQKKKETAKKKKIVRSRPATNTIHSCYHNLPKGQTDMNKLTRRLSRPAVT